MKNWMQETTPEYDLTDRFKLLAPKHGNMTFIPD